MAERTAELSSRVAALHQLTLTFANGDEGGGLVVTLEGAATAEKA